MASASGPSRPTVASLGNTDTNQQTWHTRSHKTLLHRCVSLSFRQIQFRTQIFSMLRNQERFQNVSVGVKIRIKTQVSPCIDAQRGRDEGVISYKANLAHINKSIVRED